MTSISSWLSLAAIFGRRRRRRAYAPKSNTASHDNFGKINSWVLYGYGAPLDGPSGITFLNVQQFSNIPDDIKTILGFSSIGFRCSQVEQLSVETKTSSSAATEPGIIFAENNSVRARLRFQTLECYNYIF